MLPVHSNGRPAAVPEAAPPPPKPAPARAPPQHPLSAPLDASQLPIRPISAALLLIAVALAARAVVGSRCCGAATPAAQAAGELKEPTFDGRFYQRFANATNTTSWHDAFARSVEAHPLLQAQPWLAGNPVGLRPVREWKVAVEAGLSWPENRKVVASAGLPWCNMPRDNWICVGPHYAEHLARTAPFNATRLLSQFPPGTRIFAEGNSWFGELVLTLICQSVDDPQLRVWNPIAAAGREAEHPFSVNHVAAWVKADVAIILLDNDDFWGTWGNSEFESHYEAHLGRVSGLLRDLDFDPDVFVIGLINDEPAWGSLRERRIGAYSKLYPGKVISWNFHGFKDCLAGFTNCSTGGAGILEHHACFPSNPLLRAAEDLAEGLQASLAGRPSHAGPDSAPGVVTES